ncbi:MAG: vitamin B12 dependent-methionine synthase activation domain-containing protein [Candidatus Bathyarchaeia archaeon]
MVDYIPVEYDEEELWRELHIETLKGQKKEIISMIEESRGLVEPKAVYTYLELVKIAGNNVRLESGDVLKGVILADMLKRGQKVAPYVVTIGTKLEDCASKLARENVFLSYVLEQIGNYALEIAKGNIKLLVEKKLGDRVSDFGPGEGTGKLFGIEQQAVLFRILQPSKNVGVRLTPSYLMIPRKSMSGVFAVTDEEYIACQYCPKKCEHRTSAFKGEYRPRRTSH